MQRNLDDGAFRDVHFSGDSLEPVSGFHGHGDCQTATGGGIVHGGGIPVQVRSVSVLVERKMDLAR